MELTVANFTSESIFEFETLVKNHAIQVARVLWSKTPKVPDVATRIERHGLPSIGYVAESFDSIDLKRNRILQ